MQSDEKKALAGQLFNGCWDLLEKSVRTSDDDVMLLTSAFASKYLWLDIGGPQELAVGDWMISRAAAATGFGDLAVAFAQRAVDNSPSEPDWLVASAAEGLARAYAAAGDTARREEWTATAASLVEAIVDAEDRALIANQLASIPE